MAAPPKIKVQFTDKEGRIFEMECYVAPWGDAVYPAVGIDGQTCYLTREQYEDLKAKRGPPSIADTWEATLNNIMGGILDDLLKQIEPKERPTYESAIKAAKSWMRMSFDINLRLVIISLISQLIPGISITALNRLVDFWYWALGMGFMGWQIIAPVTRQSMLNPIEEYYNRKYATRRIPMATILRLYRYNIISKEEVVEQLRNEGYKDEVIEELIEAEEQRRKDPIALDRPAPWARAGRAYALGKISREDFVRILQAHRFDEEAINIITLTFDKDREEEIAFSPELSLEVRALKRRAELLEDWLKQIRKYFKVEEIEKRMEQAKRAIARLDTRIKRLEDEISLLEEDLRRVETSLYRPMPKEERDSLLKAIKDTKVEIDKRKRRLEEIEAEVAHLSVLLEEETVEEVRENLERDIEEYRKEERLLKVEIEGLEARLLKLEGRLYAEMPEEDRKALLKELSRVSASLETKRRDLEALKLEKSRQEQRLTRLAEMVELPEHYEDLVAALEALQEEAAQRMVEEIYRILAEHGLLVKEYEEATELAPFEGIYPLAEELRVGSQETQRRQVVAWKRDRRIPTLKVIPKVEERVPKAPFIGPVQPPTHAVPLAPPVPTALPIDVTKVPKLTMTVPELAAALTRLGIPIPPPVLPPPKFTKGLRIRVPRGYVRAVRKIGRITRGRTIIVPRRIYLRLRRAGKVF